MGEVSVHALRGIDLDLYEKEFVVFLGPSGSGKSTLLNILGGLDVPTAGHVWYRGHDLTVNDDRLLTGFRRDEVVVDLGATPGGWSQVAAKRVRAGGWWLSIFSKWSRSMA